MIEVVNLLNLPTDFRFKNKDKLNKLRPWIVIVHGEVYDSFFTKEKADSIADDLSRWFM